MPVQHHFITEDIKDPTVKQLLDWTAKQGRILTANGKASNYYTTERGFRFDIDELPHHYLLEGSTWETFSLWANTKRTSTTSTKNKTHEKISSASSHNESDDGACTYHITKNPICGAWYRPLFCGGWEHSSDKEERVYNIQTNSLFVDIRIPLLGVSALQSKEANRNLNDVNEASFRIENSPSHTSIDQLNDFECRLYARRHAFGGFTVLHYHEDSSPRANSNNNITTSIASALRPTCTRHHCIDWNFVGTPRPRPNKWFVEMKPQEQQKSSHNRRGTCNAWKEWSFAKDDFGQHYYWEQWQRLENDHNGNGLVVALRKRKNENHEDGIIVIVGDHFNYLIGNRQIQHGQGIFVNKYEALNLVDLVDAAIDAGDRQIVNAYLGSIDAGHGTISSGWIIDCALQYWNEGTSFFKMNGHEGNITIDGFDVESCTIQWLGDKWDVYESSITDITQLRDLFSVETNSVAKKQKL